jgi:DNA invertase Pin-like site-specific DNA recombinase
MDNESATPLDPLQQLLAALQTPTDALEEELKPENLRYVLYARKSTIDKERQEKSIPDQIAECLDRVVKPEHITLKDSDIIRESGSAKEPDIRPEFRKMLDALIAGKYDGIITYHSDRLARNMKEAGEIIDLLDKGIIKDLRFATSVFDNTPTGKMLLGISFVLSKQFSEHLSEVVIRGNKRKTLGGKFLRSFLHGYIKTEDGRLFPDGENYTLIKTAFNMRIEGQSQAEIARYLNSRKDYRVFKFKAGDHFVYHWDKDSVSNILSDPTFAGVIRYSGGVSNIIEQYDFVPAIDASDFLKINQAKNFMSAKFKSSITAPKEKARASLLNGVVYCKTCGKTLSSGITTSKQPSYRYRCETEGCAMRNKGPRAKIITDYCIAYLDEYRFTTRSNYKNYASEVEQKKVQRAKELNSIIASLDKQILTKQKDYDNAKTIVSNPKNPLRKHYVSDLDSYTSDLRELKKAYKLATSEKKKLKTAIPTYEKYLELFDNVASLLRRTRSITQMDRILRKFYSNLTLEGQIFGPKQVNSRWEVVSVKLKEPYAGFLQTGNFERGRGERTQTFDLSVPNRARYQLRHTPIIPDKL